jgi:hypothetical protein
LQPVQLKWDWGRIAQLPLSYVQNSAFAPALECCTPLPISHLPTINHQLGKFFLKFLIERELKSFTANQSGKQNLFLSYLFDY